MCVCVCVCVCVCMCCDFSVVCVSSYVLALRPCVNVIFKPEKGERGIPSSTGFLERSSALRQIDFLPLFCPVL